MKLLDAAKTRIFGVSGASHGLGLLLCLGIVLGLPGPGQATPTITENAPFIFNRPPGDIFGVTGLQFEVFIRATDPGGVSALTGPGSSETAISSNPGFPFPQPIVLGFNGAFSFTGGAWSHSFSISTGTFPNLTGNYTTAVTNTSSQTATSIALLPNELEAIPFPTGLTTNNHSTTPIFSFTDPSPIPGFAGLTREYDFFVLDGVTHTAIFSHAPSATPSFAVPAALLTAGHPYFFRADSLDLDFTGDLNPIQFNLVNQSAQYLSFTPVPAPATLLLLGSAVAGLASLAWRRESRK